MWRIWTVIAAVACCGLLISACGGGGGGTTVDRDFTAEEASDATGGAEAVSVMTTVTGGTEAIYTSLEENVTLQTGVAARQWVLLLPVEEIEAELATVYGDTIEIEKTGLYSMRITFTNTPFMGGLAMTTGVVDLMVRVTDELDIYSTMSTTNLIVGPYTVSGSWDRQLDAEANSLEGEMSTSRQTNTGATRTLDLTFSGEVNANNQIEGDMTFKVNGDSGPSLTCTGIVYDEVHVYPIAGVFTFTSSAKTISVSFTTTGDTTTATMTATDKDPRTVTLPGWATQPS